MGHRELFLSEKDKFPPSPPLSWPIRSSLCTFAQEDIALFVLLDPNAIIALEASQKCL